MPTSAMIGYVQEIRPLLAILKGARIIPKSEREITIEIPFTEENFVNARTVERNLKQLGFIDTVDYRLRPMPPNLPGAIDVTFRSSRLPNL